MINNKACILCKNINELDQIVTNLFQNTKEINLIKIKAKKFADNSFFEIEKIISKIDNCFKEVKC